jgi:hypothetical protein
MAYVSSLTYACKTDRNSYQSSSHKEDVDPPIWAEWTSRTTDVPASAFGPIENPASALAWISRRHYLQNTSYAFAERVMLVLGLVLRDVTLASHDNTKRKGQRAQSVGQSDQIASSAMPFWLKIVDSVIDEMSDDRWGGPMFATYALLMK